jgi:hypothetical protein
LPQDKKRRFQADELQGDLLDKIKSDWTSVLLEEEEKEYMRNMNGEDLVLDTTNDDTNEWL